MVSVKKIDSTNFDRVYPLLADLNPNFTKADWDRVLDYRWQRQENYSGYGLFDEEKLVGFLGSIFSQRKIAQNTENFVNIHSWIVEPEYRNYSISLILPLSRLRHHTITDMSPAPRVIGVLQKLGFQKLDSQLKLLLPLSLFKQDICDRNIDCITDITKIAQQLKEPELNLFQDHLGYSDCNHLLVSNNGSYCYILFTKVNTPRFSYCYLHHLSDRDFFFKYNKIIRPKIHQMTSNPWIIVDSRLVNSLDLPLSYNLPLSFPKLYKSSHLKPEQIDNLYSELPLLNFSLLPTNFQELKELWQDSQYWRSLQ
jgi:hypothetical protein